MMSFADCNPRVHPRSIRLVVSTLLLMWGWGYTAQAETVMPAAVVAPVVAAPAVAAPIGTTAPVAPPVGVNTAPEGGVPTGMTPSAPIATPQTGVPSNTSAEGQPQTTVAPDGNATTTLDATVQGELKVDQNTVSDSGNDQPNTDTTSSIDDTSSSQSSNNEGPIDVEAMFALAPQQLGRSSAPENFGYDIFRQATSTFAPTNNAAVGPDYMVGPGDQFVVHIWGRVNGDYPLQVGREGSVVIPQVGTIDVSGLTFGALDEYLTQQIGRVLTDFTLHVTMGQLRTIRIYVIGEVDKPGSYEVSSLTSLYQALFVAGGPTHRGSLRQIQLRRPGQTPVTSDLYNFLLKGDRSQDQALQNGDTIFVPLVGIRAGISGPIRRPATYEFSESPNLGQLIDMAGGLEPTAWLNKVQVRRIEENEWHTVLDLDLTHEKQGQARKFKLKDRDQVSIYPILPNDTQVVRLIGHVAHSGTISFQKGMTLADLFPNHYDDLLAEPYLGYGEILRIAPPLYETRLLTFNLGDVLEGRTVIPLHPMDTIRVYPASFYQTGQTLEIKGAVRHQGSFHFHDGITLLDLIHRAGDLLPNTYMDRVEISRLNPVGSVHQRRLIVLNNLQAIIDGNQNAPLLEAQDVVTIFNVDRFRPPQVVVISGEIRNPSEVAFKEGMTLFDLIQHAGGPTNDTYMGRLEISRLNPKGSENTRRLIVLSDIQPILEGTRPSPRLEPQDIVTVFSVKRFRPDQIASIVGEVRNPGEVDFKEGMTLFDLIQHAGGPTNDTYMGRLEISRLNPKGSENTRRLIVLSDIQPILEGTRPSPPLEPQDIVTLFNVNHFRPAQVVRISGEVRNPGEVNFKEGMTLFDLVQFAGGPTNDTYMGRLEISRLNPPGSLEARSLLSIPRLADLLAGKGPNPPLQPQDDVKIYNRAHFEPEASVGIQGEVLNPGNFTLMKGMRLLDLVYAAGLKRSSYLKSVELGRTWFDGTEMKHERRNIDLELVIKGDESANPLLQARDYVVVRPIPDWKEDRTVTLRGEIVFPGTYRLDDNETLAHLVERAGGFTDAAYLPGAIFSRQAVKASEESRKQELIRLQESIIAADLQQTQASSVAGNDASVLDSRMATAKMLIERLKSTPMLGRIVLQLHQDGTVEGSVRDLPMEDGDTLFVPSKPAQVAVLGEVYNPTAFMWDEDLDVGDYLALAGGNTEQANTDGIYVIKANGSVISAHSRFFGIEGYSLAPGDTVLVPQLLQEESFVSQALPWSTLMYNMAVAAKVLLGF